MANVKTNAVRMLDSNKINYKLYEYKAPEGFLDGVSVAEAIGSEVDSVYKTLVTVGASKEYYVCVIPVNAELDMKKAAKHFGEKNMEMIPAKDITKITGYIKGGCSPVGMKKLYKTAIDISAESRDFIIFSAGKVGLQMETSPLELRDLVKAQFAELKVK